MKFVIQLLALGLVLAGGAFKPVNADTLFIDQLTSTSMTISYTGPAQQYVDSQQFAFTGGTLNGIAYELYCVDLTNRIVANSSFPNSGVTNDGTVDWYDPFNVPGTLTIPQAAAEGIAWLLTTFAEAASMSDDTRLGLQAAIWKVEYGANFDLVLPGMSSWTTQATVDAYTAYYTNGYLANGGPHTAPVSDVKWISPHFYQDEHDIHQGLAGVPARVVPEPCSLILTLVGLVGSGLVSTRYRRRPVARLSREAC
jgi:hypothetical protein